MGNIKINIITYVWKSHLLPLVLFDGIVYLLAGLFTSIPEVTGPAGLFLGLINFTVINSTDTNKAFGRVVKTLIVTLGGSLVGILLLWSSCSILKNRICYPNNFRATVFGALFFAQIIVIGLIIGTDFRRKSMSE